MKLNQVIPYWTEIRQGLIEAVKDLTDEELDWRPPGGLNSVGMLARHILSVQERDVDGFVLGRGPGRARGTPGRARRTGTTGVSSDAEVRAGAGVSAGAELAADLAEAHAELEAFLASADAEVLLETRPWGGGRRTVGDAVWNALIEELHHRGQVFMLLRLMGKEPPAI